MSLPPHQLTLDHAKARAEGDAGMRAALEHAEQAHYTWPDLAYTFLELYCRRHLSFTAEDVTVAADRYGLIQPPTIRAWGGVYIRAKNAGMIERDGTAPRAFGHGSPGIRWKSKIFCVPAM